MARLADVARPEPAVYTPTVRARVLQRIDAAAASPITLIVAPAGYGKSVALAHWLERLSNEYARFNVQAEHNSLLGFARGLSEAFAAKLPALRKTVSSAHQSSSSSVTPGAEMARWMASHLESYSGLIAIDDFHRAGDDLEISRFLSALVARTKSRVRWLIATRSTLDLPVASWLAYRDVEFIIGDRELVFSEEEARELTERTGAKIADGALRDVLEATSGWPVALGFALRDSGAAQHAANVTATTREMLFQFLAEQVYGELSSGERDLLHFASYLPSIDVALLEAAGYDQPARTLESIRKRATFFSLESPGVYKCHDLFRDFLRRQLELEDAARARKLQFVAAATLEEAGSIAGALRIYTHLRANDDVLRLLHSLGFELIDHSHGEAVGAAIGALPLELRTSDPAVLGLRAQRETDAGRFDRAEALFKKAIDSTADLRLRRVLSIRLAILLGNQGRRIHELLSELPTRDAPAESVAEIFALQAIDYANAREVNEARRCIEMADSFCTSLESDEVRAKVLLRMGIAGLSVNLPEERVLSTIGRAHELAIASEMPAIAAKVHILLASVCLFYRNDIGAGREEARAAVGAAIRGGDRHALHAALAYEMVALRHQGDRPGLEAALAQLAETPTTDVRRIQTIRLDSLAAIAAWSGNIARAATLMESFALYEYGYYDFEQALALAAHALYLAVLGEIPSCTTLIAKALDKIAACRAEHAYSIGKRAIATLVCALAAALAGNAYRANRILRSASEELPGSLAPLKAAVGCIVERRHAAAAELALHLSDVERAGYVGLAQTIRACFEAWTSSQDVGQPEAQLTRAEREVLSALDLGQSAKDIALHTNRSVHTVRTLVQRAIEKLGCSGRLEALAVARERGLLPQVNAKKS